MALKGKSCYDRFLEGKPLTRRDAIIAQCAVCNGFEGEDCQGKDCPLYQFTLPKKSAFNRRRGPKTS